MKAEMSFIKKLEAFFDDEFNDYTKSRIELYLKEYRQEIPPVIIKKEIFIEKPIEGKSIEEKRKELSYRTNVTEQDLYNTAKEFCDIYKINLDEFINRKNLKAKSDIVDVRKIFCSMMFSRYHCNTNTLAKFFKVHHSTISFYVHGKKFRKATLSQTKKLSYA